MRGYFYATQNPLPFNIFCFKLSYFLKFHPSYFTREYSSTVIKFAMVYMKPWNIAIKNNTIFVNYVQNIPYKICR